MNASIDPATTGSSYEMYAIAAVVLGGINMAGGRGRRHSLRRYELHHHRQ